MTVELSSNGSTHSRPPHAGYPSKNVPTWNAESMGVRLEQLLQAHARSFHDSFKLCHCSDLAIPSFVYRENRVPYYQRLMQKHDGKRTWWKVSQPKQRRPDPKARRNDPLQSEGVKSIVVESPYRKN